MFAVLNDEPFRALQDINLQGFEDINLRQENIQLVVFFKFSENCRAKRKARSDVSRRKNSKYFPAHAQNFNRLIYNA